MKEFIKGMYTKPNFRRRLTAVILAVITMGFSLSWLKLVDLGVDPCTNMHLAISGKIGMSLGNWQALFNSLLFLIVIFKGKEYIGFGTLANMFLVGYSIDFFSWLWDMLLPEGMFQPMAVRIGVLIPALAIFVVAAGVYMDVELGTAPYDAIPLIFAQYHENISFRWIRMGYDFTIIIVGALLGAKVGIVTILMGFTLGPVIALVGEKLSGFLGVE